jgi:hypothetical protein
VAIRSSACHGLAGGGGTSAWRSGASQSRGAHGRRESSSEAKENDLRTWGGAEPLDVIGKKAACGGRAVAATRAEIGTICAHARA